MNKGFSLIEILISVSIISILIAIGVYTFPRLSINSRNTRREVDFEQIRGALESFRSNDVNASYPAAPANLVTSGYFQSLPDDPRTRADYILNYRLGSCVTPTMCSNYQIHITLEGTGNQFLVGSPIGTQRLNVTPTPLP